MVDDLSVLYPRPLIPLLNWLGRVGPWLEVTTPPASPTVKDILLPRTLYRIRWEVIDASPDKPMITEFRNLLDHMERNVSGRQLTYGFLEAGGVMVKDGPKLFAPTFEQFESLGHVDLHIPIADFRSPYPAFVIRIPNEWRREKSRELNIDVQRQPLHAMVRTTTTTEGAVHIMCVLRYGDYEHYNVVTDQPFHQDLQSAFNFIVNYVGKDSIAEHVKTLPPEEQVGFWEKRNEYKYCTDAIHAALNCCLMLVNFGNRLTGPLDPRVHARNCKTNSDRRHADFQGVSMLQDIIIRQTSGVLGEPLARPAGDAADDREPLYEVKPHWRRGHWRRRPGWREFVERGERPPQSFVRPTLVRKDRLVGDASGSQVTYRVR